MPALCGVCKQRQFKYTCPRCEVLYCSLPCYQNHSSKCTESFYQQQVQEELQSQKATGEEKKRLEQIVSKLNKLDSDSEDEEGECEDECEEEEYYSEEGIAERRLEELAARAENGDLNFEDLSAEEAMRFHSEIKRGALGRLLSAWEPWWQAAGVVEVSSLDTLEENEHEGYAVEKGNSMPSSPPQDICCPEGRQPNKAVAFTALSVLYGYAHTMRTFNGEWSWATMEAAPQVLHLCPGICSHKVYETAHACFRESLTAAAALPGRGLGFEFDLLCLSDVSAIIRGGADFLLRALLEVIKMLEACIAGGGRGRTGKLQRGVKKLEFLSSFVYHHYELMQPLERQVELFEKQENEKNTEVAGQKNALDHDGIAMPERQ